MTTTTRIARRVAGTIVAVAALVFTSTALAAPGVAPMPAFPGAVASIGASVDIGKPAASIGILATKPDVAIAGTDFSVSGSNLPANKDVLLTWSTATIDWLLDARPDSVDYLGRKATNYNVQLGVAHTDATVRIPAKR